MMAANGKNGTIPTTTTNTNTNTTTTMMMTPTTTAADGNHHDDQEKVLDTSMFLNLLHHPEEGILELLHDKKDPQEIRLLCQQFFAQIEHYHGLLMKQQQKHRIKSGNRDDNKSKNTTATATVGSSLTGLDELFLCPDAETIWGQVELQNEALRTVLRKQVSKLSQHTDDVQLLDLDQIISEDEEEEQHNDDKDDEDDDDDKDDEDSKDDGQEMDEETKRIRARMARAMAEMDDDNDDDDDDDDNEESDSDESEGDDKLAVAKTSNHKKKHQDKEEETAMDPIRESMRDGFFDLHEMEAFADEEEEYLPDEAYGEEEEEDTTTRSKSVVKDKKKSFHQRQRDGEVGKERNDDTDDSNSDDEDDILTSALAKRQSLVRRKKYRPDDEVDALFTLYETPQDDDDENDEAIHMTAADFFGKPDVSAMKKYGKKTKQENIRASNDENDDDADSWDNHDFDDTEGWNDQRKKDDQDDDNNDDDVESDHDNKDDDENNGSEQMDEPNPTPTSKFGKQSLKLEKQTLELEQEMLAEKPWHMIGEAKGTARPLNSLVESTPEFETATKAAPIITVEHTTNLEDLIKKRILNEDWDNLIPRELPDVGWNKKRGELPEVSQEKSKLGLGELYEREYLKKAVGYDKDAVEKETEETKAKDEMKALFASLCSKLDALSNYHFAPRPISDEAEVRAISTPAIAMEEILPLHVSDARGVAPEEVYGAKQGRDAVLRADSELTQDERKRLRNAKKTARRKARKSKQADEKLITRLQPSGVGLSNPYEKRKMREELQLATARGRVVVGKEDKNSDYGASSKFFQRMQDEVQDGVRIDSHKRQRLDDGPPKKKSSVYKL